MRTTLLVSRDLDWSLALATDWVAAGDYVTVVLLDSAVAATRRGHAAAARVRAAVDAGATLVAEEQALRSRAVPSAEGADGIKVVSLDEVADLLVDGTDKAVWL